MLRLAITLCCFLSLSALVQAQLLSPSEFLGRPHGEHFTPHHQIAAYVRHVAEQSEQVELQQYGTTYEGRPLLLATISAPENLRVIDSIRINNLRRTGLQEGPVNAAYNQAIVWLSFGVHGNEAGATESAMSTLYTLAAADRAALDEWLQQTVVLLDPALNPDGYSRYTHWYRSVAPLKPVPEPRTRSHREPWPGGRVNHYLFDLNRDWAWQTQQETRQRLDVFRQWMPHIHVDYHEQFPNSPYYFAPAASPYHSFITDWQADFQHTMGESHANYFDREGWLYFTREVFDLFYPSYGDTYPIFNGSIGMTHEQAGHGISGRAILMENEDTLTLRDRIDHHTATAISTVETAAKYHEKLIENFSDYFDKARNMPSGTYKSFVISRDNPPGRVAALIELLERNQIEYGSASTKQRLSGFDYQSRETENIFVQEGDLVISAYQPMSVLAQVLFDPSPVLEDSMTYDITAWALPYAYGLKAAAMEQRVSMQPGWEPTPVKNNLEAERAYAYIAPWSSMQDARFLSAVLQAGIKARVAEGAFSIKGDRYEAGSLVFTEADNRKMGIRFHEKMRELAARYEHPLQAVSTGFSDDGFDLGSGGMNYLETPHIAVLSGDETSVNSFGEIWYFLERKLGYPAYFFQTEDFGRISLQGYNTLIMPEGNYDFEAVEWEQLMQWIKEGGRLIAVGSALRSLSAQEPFGLKAKTAEAAEESSSSPLTRRYGDSSRERLSGSLPGAIFEVELDETHPLAFGLSKPYFTLKTSSAAYAPLQAGWNIGKLPEDASPIGFAGSEALKRVEGSVVIAQQQMGRGSIVLLADNPLFRAFWEHGQLLFSNALFMHR